MHKEIIPWRVEWLVQHYHVQRDSGDTAVSFSTSVYLIPFISDRASVLTEMSGKHSHYQEDRSGLVSSHHSLSVC